MSPFQQDCEYDSVEVHSGLEKESSIHGTFCGTQLPQSLTSEGNTLRLTFSTDNTVQKTGFVVHYFTGRFMYIYNMYIYYIQQKYMSDSVGK